MMYDHPWAVYGLILVIPFLYLIVKTFKSFFHLDKLFRYDENKGKNKIRGFKAFLLFAAFLLSLLSFMGPKGNPRYSEAEIKLESEHKKLTENALDLIILLDVSSSMSATDTPSHASRLNQAVNYLDDFLSKLGEPYVTFYSFTSDLELEVPRTLDMVFLRLLLRQTSLNETGVPGTDYLKVLKKLQAENIHPGQVVLIVSDGDDTGSETDPGRVSQIASAFKGTVLTLGVGSIDGGVIPNVLYNGHPVTSKLNEALLKKIGEYRSIDQVGSASLVQILNRKAAEKRQIDYTPDKNLIYTHYYQVPLGLALLFLILAYSLPKSFKTALMLLPLFSICSDSYRDARMWLEASKPLNALKIYSEIIPQNEWEKGAKAIDLAIGYIDEKNFYEAWKILSAIDLSKQASPYFEEKLFELKSRLWLLDLEPLKEESLFASLTMALSAESARCHLQKLKGDPGCTQDYIITALKTAIKNELQGSNVEKAFQELVSNIKKEIATPADDAEVLLKEAIKQSKAFFLLLNLEEKPLHDLMVKSAARLNDFFSLSYKSQVKTFLQKGCENVAWDQVYLLFDKGMRALTISIDADTKTTGNLALLEARNYFEEALKKMKAPYKPPESQESRESRSETLRTFQDLELMDRSQKPIIVNPTGVDKPW